MKKVICGFSQGSVLTLSLSNFQEQGYWNFLIQFVCVLSLQNWWKYGKAEEQIGSWKNTEIKFRVAELKVMYAVFMQWKTEEMKFQI